MSYADRLKKLNDTYKKTDALKGSTFSRPDDGDYHMRVEKAILEVSKKGKLKGMLQVSWQLVIVGGGASGKKAFKRTTLEGEYAETGLGILKGDLEMMGIKLKNLGNLTGKNGALPKTIGKILECRVQSAKDPRFYNVYFNGLVEEMPEEGDIDAAEDDDTSFENEEEEIDLEEKVVEEDEEEEEEEEEEDTDPDSWSLDDLEEAG